MLGKVSYKDCSYVHHILYMPHSGTALTFVFCSSFGTHLFYHLAADGACFPGSQLTVVAVGQVNANFLSGLHLEAVHKLTPEGRER